MDWLQPWRRKAEKAVGETLQGEIATSVHVLDGRLGQEDAWFASHLDQAAVQCLEFLAEAGVALQDRRVCDIGCGDGLIDAGILQRSAAREFVGFDIAPGGSAALHQALKRHGYSTDSLSNFRMVQSGVTSIPSPDHYFDVAVSWSAFEHVADPTALLREVRRILVPGGVLFLQLWPFFWLQHGTHLWQWFPDGYANQLHTDAEIQARLTRDSETDPGWKQMMFDAYSTLNRFTVRDLEASLIDAGFEVKRFQLLTDTIQIPDNAEWCSSVDRAISGVKLVATTAG